MFPNVSECLRNVFRTFPEWNDVSERFRTFSDAEIVTLFIKCEQCVEWNVFKNDNKMKLECVRNAFGMRSECARSYEAIRTRSFGHRIVSRLVT